MLPDQVWPFVANQWQTLDQSTVPPSLRQSLTTVLSVFSTLAVSMLNALFAAFDVHVDDDHSMQDPVSPKDVEDGAYQLLVQDKIWNRYDLVVSDCRAHPAVVCQSERDDGKNEAY